MAMMCLTFVDVLARYVFHRPIRGAFELTELMLLVLIFAGLPLVSHADEHVTMDFIDRWLRGRLRLWHRRIIEAIVAALMFFMSWQVLIKAQRISSYADATDVLRILYGPFVYFMALTIGLTGAIHVYRMFSK